MKALTLWPEWLFAVLYLGKRVENRPRRPAFYGLHPGDWLAWNDGLMITAFPIEKKEDEK